MLLRRPGHLAGGDPLFALQRQVEIADSDGEVASRGSGDSAGVRLKDSRGDFAAKELFVLCDQLLLSRPGHAPQAPLPPLAAICSEGVSVGFCRSLQCWRPAACERLVAVLWSCIISSADQTRETHGLLSGAAGLELSLPGPGHPGHRVLPRRHRDQEASLSN